MLLLKRTAALDQLSDQVTGHQPVVVVVVVVVVCMQKFKGATPTASPHNSNYQLSHPTCHEPEAQPHHSGSQTGYVQTAASCLLAAVTSLSRVDCTCG
jgi:hypothetical protein